MSMCDKLLEECCLERTIAYVETGRMVNWLEDSRRTSALTQANIANSGTEDSFISSSHVTRKHAMHIRWQ